MLTNARRRELLDNVRRSGYPGSISEVFQAAQGGRGLVREFEMQQQQQQEMQVANTPEEQEVGLREEHAAGNTNASMAFPNVQPNQSFNTVGMQAPIDIQKIDNQGHLVESYKNVPPGIQDLPTGPAEGTVIESPAAYQKGGTRFSMGAEGNVNCLPGVAGCYGYESPLTLKPNFAFTYDTGRKHIGVQAGANLQTYFGGSDTREGAPVLAGGISGGIGTNPTSKELETSKHLSLIGKLGFKRRNLEGAHDWSSFNPGWDAGLYGKYDLLNKQLQDVGVYGSYGALEANLGYNPTQKMLQAGLGLRLGKRQTGGIKKYGEGGLTGNIGQGYYDDVESQGQIYDPESDPSGSTSTSPLGGGSQDYGQGNTTTGSMYAGGGNTVNAFFTNSYPGWVNRGGEWVMDKGIEPAARYLVKNYMGHNIGEGFGGKSFGELSRNVGKAFGTKLATSALGSAGSSFGKKMGKKFLPKSISKWFQKGGTRKKGGYKGYKQRICKYGCM